MSYLLNVCYLLLLFLLSPWLLYKALTTGKYRRGLPRKFLGLAPLRDSNRICVWFHGVSVGEIHLLRQVVSAFRGLRADVEVVVSSTTDTGLEEARKNFPELTIFYWPLDFTWAVNNAIRRIQPDLVVLAESEIWPNFLFAAKKAGVKTAVINGRLSVRSAQRYRRFAFFLRPVLRCVDLWLMQTEDYAQALRAAFSSDVRTRILATGNVKYDGVQTNRHNSETQSLRRLFAIADKDLVFVAGSTQSPEEEVVLNIYQRLSSVHPDLRLILVPRQRERFDEVAELLRGSAVPFSRRSTLNGPVSDRNGVILVDTIGELRAVWGLADIAYVGGSLDGKRGGQNMIEPAAYGAAVLFGPHVWNFRETVKQLINQNAAIQIADAAKLEKGVAKMLGDSETRQRFSTAAQQFVISQQGATVRTVLLLEELLGDVQSTKTAA